MKNASLAAAAWGLCAWLAAAPALAGNVVARAGQNPTDLLVDNQAGASASAQFGPMERGGFSARANATRSLLEAASDGTGGSTVRYFFASANHRTDYELWDINTNTALTAAQSEGLVFNFNFALDGALLVQGQPNTQSSGQVEWAASVVAGARSDAADSSAIIAFGPSANDIDGEFLFIGDSRLHGAFSQTFSLQHQRGRAGVLAMSVSGSAGNLAQSSATLRLAGLTWADAPQQLSTLASASMLTADTLAYGIRLQTGEILAISPVPEPEGWLMALSGLAVLGWLRRRNACFSAPNKLSSSAQLL